MVINAIFWFELVVITMGLTNKKEEQLRKMPLIETKFFKSKNNRFIVHQTTITTIRPVEYFQKVLENEGTIDETKVGQELEIVNGADLVEA